MFFSRKPTTFILVERERLLLYPKAKTTTLDISTELFEYLEVKDAARLSAVVLEFAKKNQLAGQRVLLMLHKAVVFQKGITLANGVDPAAATTDFISKVPFNPDDRKIVSLQQKDRLFLFGTNKAYYELLANAFLQAGAKVQAVVPAIVYGVTDSDKLNQAKLDQIAHAATLTQSVNFLEGTRKG